MISKRPSVAILALALAFGGSSGATAGDAKDFQVTPLEPVDLQAAPKSPRGEVSVLVKLDVDSVAAYKGGLPGLAATNPRAAGLTRLDARSPQARAYESFLAGKEQTFERAVKASIPQARIVHRFRQIFGGVSLVLPADRVAELARMPGVRAVYPDALLPLDTDRSPEFIGAPALWDQVGGQGNAGAGVIVGMLDTGIWPEHPSVADDGSYPPPPANWTGTACQFGSAKPGDAVFTCNNKLIGAARHMETFDFFGGGAGTPLPGEYFTARDNNGHGSHTATTAAGNAGVLAPTGGLVSGIAPRAHLAVYKICFTVPVTGGGSCYTSDSAAAIEQGILDGVDVFNFSIAGGTNPYSDAVSLAFLDAYEAGVFVAASAGNSGPGLDTVAHREPWVATAAATTTDKGFAGHADVTADGGAALTVTGVSATGEVGPASIVLAENFSDGVVGGGASCPGVTEGESDRLCCNAFPPGTFTGQIVVCKRGTNARVQKSANVKAGGAAGMILYNPTANTLNADLHSVPSLHIDNVQGASLVSFINTQANEAATLARDDIPGQGDVMANFSSRGGAGQTLGISKPDLGAPGVNILAANSPFLAVPIFPGQADLFQIISGTSMASPHVAGAGALLRQLHPDWTPGQIKSALMMTATTENTVKENGVTPTTPFDIGSGRIDLERAGHPGITISDTADNYWALQGNLSLSNYPSLYIPVGAGRAVVQRTLKNVENRKGTWNLSVEAPPDLSIEVPRQVRIPKFAHKTIALIIDASGIPLGQTRHANVRFDDGERVLSFPVTVVRKQGAITIDKSCDPTLIAQGATTNCAIDVTNTSFDDQQVIVYDQLPKLLRLGDVTGGVKIGTDTISFVGTLGAATPPQVSVAAGTSPFGYLPLSGFGVTPIAGVGDESIVNFTLSAGSFLYAGAAYNRFGVTSNGYVVVGGGTSADVQFVNQSLPNPSVPNNVLAAFWSDLNASAALGGAMRVAILTSGPDAWVICDWENVPNYSNTAQKNSFQVWIGLNGVQDISFTYGTTTSGDLGLLTVGAENLLGNSGGNFYYNGTGTLPDPTTEVTVSGGPGAPGETHTISFTAEGRKPGTWRNCAELLSSVVFGTGKSCVDGEVIK